MTQVDVSFPMYNLPEMAPAYQALWDALVDELQKEGVTGLPTARSPSSIRARATCRRSAARPISWLLRSAGHNSSVVVGSSPARR
jgi:hypothetical protein